MMTPEEARAELVRRLKDGRYTQGKHALKVVYPDGHAEHCCLGLGCEIAADGGLGCWIEYDGGITNPDLRKLVDEENVQVMAFVLARDPELRRATEVLPHRVADFFGFRSTTGVYGGDVHPSLAIANDAGVPFGEVAQRVATDETLLKS